MPSPLNHDAQPGGARAAGTAGTVATTGQGNNSTDRTDIQAPSLDPSYSGPALWCTKDHNIPVMITGYAGLKDGRDWFTTADSTSAVPGDELRPDLDALFARAEVTPSPSSNGHTPAVIPQASEQDTDTVEHLTDLGTRAGLCGCMAPICAMWKPGGGCIGTARRWKRATRPAPLCGYPRKRP